jgi:hypothetical protein
VAMLRAWRGTSAAASSLPQLQYKALLGQHVVVPIGGNADCGTPLPNGLQLIFDFSAYWEGEVAYRPKFDDSRMRLRGTKLPPFSGDDGFVGGIKIHTMVQRYGLCSLLTTADSMTRVIEVLYDAFIFAAEGQAGQLPVYRIEPPRGFTTRHRPDVIHAPCYSMVGWVGRDADAFGPRLIPPPKPMVLSTELTPTPVLESDDVFAAVAPRGEVLPPKPKTKVSKHGARQIPLRGPQSDPDLEDAVPF